MTLVNRIARSLLWLLISTFKLCWNLLSLFIAVVDGDEEDTSGPDYLHYNHRNGDLDPVRRSDGLYDNSY